MSHIPSKLSRRAEATIERSFDMNARAWQLLDLICSEWRTDPQSVQCFDSRMVREAIDLVAERKSIASEPLVGDPFQEPEL